MRPSLMAAFGLVLLAVTFAVLRALELLHGTTPTPALTAAFTLSVTAAVAALGFAVHQNGGSS